MRVISILSALALTACATVPAEAGPKIFSGTASGRMGERIKLADLRITPLKIIEDSRCPRDVQCVWAGRLVLSAKVELDGKSRDMNLELGQGIALEDARSLTLSSVEPSDKRSNPPSPPPSHFTFTLGPGD